jgi:hypothetical protein
VFYMTEVFHGFFQSFQVSVGMQHFIWSRAEVKGSRSLCNSGKFLSDYTVSHSNNTFFSPLHFSELYIFMSSMSFHLYVRNFYVGFVVFTVMNIKLMAFWDMTPCNSIDIYVST